MFQIDNIDDKKTEWDLNETRIIIPLVDGDALHKEPDKIVRTVNLISEDGEQKSPTGNLEHNLVIGVDKNIFEPHNTKSDLLIIQDSDLKLLSCNPDLKNQLGYSLSFLNQNRSETLWENPGLKDKPKEWSHENAILEVKDILIYEEKANENINLDHLKRESKSFVTQLREETQKEEIVEEPKNEKNFQLIINYIPKCYNISSKGDIANYEILTGNIKNNVDENIFKKMVNVNSVRVSSNNFINFKGGDNGNASEVSEIQQKNVVLPEKSLPLKKKAKMKRTVTCYDNQRSLLKQELIKNRQLQVKSFFDNKTEELQSSFEQQECNIRKLEKSCNKISKQRKTQKPSQILKKLTSDSPAQENKNEAVKFEKESTDADLLRFDITNFKNIYDLVEGLRKYRMISVPVWQMLNTGLKEMNVDILKEIIERRKEPEGGNYSPQLKAFALVVYFKQPVAFNFLAKVCKNGWPSLNVIKEWKLQLNSHQRPNFVGVQRKTESDVS